jgi:hypothetical protein
MMVSSTLLWQRLLRDRQANAPWQRLRRNLLLLLQLMILLALVLALARPFIPVPTVISGSVVVLLDGSASMWATDDEPNRFEKAREEITKIISDLGNSDQMTLILVGSTPSVLASASGDKQELLESLESAAAGNGPVDWEAAFALAAGAAQGFEESRIAIISDGGLPADLPSLPGEIVYIPVGSQSENSGITSRGARQTGSGLQLFTQIKNYGDEDQETLLSLELDERFYESKRVEIKAGEEYSEIWELSEDLEQISLRLSGQEADYLPLDDEAWAINEDKAISSVLLISVGNRFLETVLTLNPGVELFRAEPEESAIDVMENSYDLFIYDDVAWPNPMPAGDGLLIHPQPPMTAFGEDDLQVSFAGPFTGTEVIRLVESPLQQFVEWGNVNIREAELISASWLQTLVMAEDGPLLMVGEKGGRRYALLTFRLQDSDLPLQIAFPVLMANIVDWLNPGRVINKSSALSPGETMVLTPGTTTDAVVVYLPDGGIWVREAAGDPITFAQSDELGVYHIGLRSADSEQAAGSFAVNLFSDSESNIKPLDKLQLGLLEVDTRAEENLGQRELWPFLAAAAIIILIIEWWFYHRGGINLARFRTDS